jgi:hypothetical protein
MKTRTRLLLIPLLAFASALVGFQVGQSNNAQAEPVAIIVDTPSAPHPKARVRVIDLQSGTIHFTWLDASGNPVDSGNSIAPITVTGESITTEQRAILAAGITAATATPPES